FTVASLLCGAAPNAGVLVAARTIQGVGAALMVPQVLTCIQALFTGRALVTAVGLYSLMLGIGVSAGQVLGGVLVTANPAGMGWRAVFLVNLPIGAAVLLMAGRVPRVRAVGRIPLDRAGTTLLALAMLLLLVPVTFGREYHWPAWTWPTLAASVGVGAWFVRTERRVAERGGAPLLHPDLARAPGFLGGIAAIFVSYVGYGGLLFCVAVHLQTGLGYSPLRSGLAFVPYSFGFGAVNILWSRLPHTWHKWAPVAGVGALIVANAAIAAALTAGSGGWTGWDSALLALAGVGNGLSFGALVAQIVARVAPAHASGASGAITTIVQLGIAVGVAAVGAVYLAGGSSTDPGADARGLATAAAALAAAETLVLFLVVRVARAGSGVAVVTRPLVAVPAPASTVAATAGAAKDPAGAELRATEPDASMTCGQR
ncbi:MAG: hypothetical protein QOD07_2960, partial [Frankiaceae bacterium]|nr:hypothetical protein [Frankiaceae bacterium]